MTVPTVTKSIHLTAEDAEIVRLLAEQESLDESALLQQLFADGLRVHLLERAIRSYSLGQASIGEAASMAQMPYLAFFKELRRRRIVVLDESVNLKAELADLAQKLNNERLAKVADEL